MTDALVRCEGTTGCGWLVPAAEIAPCSICEMRVCATCRKLHLAWGCASGIVRSRR